MEFCKNNNMREVKMVSFDVTSLLTSMPLEPTLNFIERKIDENHISIPIPKLCFLNLIRICVNNNVFQFEDSYYRQKFGVAMGSPLSPVLANIFMEFFESELLADITGKPVLWLRYIDDVFALYSNSYAEDVFTVDWESFVTTLSLKEYINIRR